MLCNALVCSLFLFFIGGGGGLRLYVPVNNFSVMLGRFPGLNQFMAMRMKCLAQGHNTSLLVRFEPATLRSSVRHSTGAPTVECIFNSISLYCLVLY